MSHYGEHSAAGRVAHGLGWFSVALGVAELAAPDAMARLIGVPNDDRVRTAIRAMGAREVATGVAILTGSHAPGVWSRVGGDALDLALLGSAMSFDETHRTRLMTAAGAVLGVMVLDAICATQLQGEYDPQRRRRRAGDHVRVEYAATVNKPIGEVYRFWCDFERFPSFMRHLESVRLLDDGRSRWRAKAPAGFTVEWEAEEVGRRENEWIGWRSVQGSGIENSGSVTFAHAPGARGTEVRVVIEYRPPAGQFGRTIARLLGEEPEGQLREDLRRFKQLIETGEVTISDSPGLRRPAQPARSAQRAKSLAGVRE